MSSTTARVYDDHLLSDRDAFVDDAQALSTATLSGEPIRYSLGEGHRLLIEIPEGAPDWLLPTVQAMGHLLTLESGWDSYGAARIHPENVEAALRLLLNVMKEATPAPSVVPTSSGGVQLEWHVSGVDLEIETLSAQRFSVFFEDYDSKEQPEELEIVSDLRPLTKWISKLTEEQ